MEKQVQLSIGQEDSLLLDSIATAILFRFVLKKYKTIKRKLKSSKKLKDQNSITMVSHSLLKNHRLKTNPHTTWEALNFKKWCLAQLNLIILEAILSNFHQSYLIKRVMFKKMVTYRRMKICSKTNNQHQEMVNAMI